MLHITNQAWQGILPFQLMQLKASVREDHVCRLKYRGWEVYKGNSGRSQSHGFHLFRGAGNFRFASVRESGGGGGEIRLSRFCKGFFQGAGGLFC